MVYTFKEISFDNKQTLIAGLSKVYGLGFSKSRKILSKVGYNSFSKFGELSRYQFMLLSTVLKRKVLVDENMKRVKYLNMKRVLVGRTYRSLRLNKGLPVRGQSTKTNARTAKRLNKINLS